MAIRFYVQGVADGSLAHFNATSDGTETWFHVYLPPAPTEAWLMTTNQTGLDASDKLWISTDNGVSWTGQYRSPLMEGNGAAGTGWGPHSPQPGVVLILPAGGTANELERMVEPDFSANPIPTTIVPINIVALSVQPVVHGEGYISFIRNSSKIVYVSADAGATWTASTITDSDHIQGLNRVNGVWVATGGGPSPVYAYYSTEDVPTTAGWVRGTRIDNILPSGAPSGAIVSNGSVGVAFGNVGGHIRTTTGLTWSLGTDDGTVVSGSRPYGVNGSTILFHGSNTGSGPYTWRFLRSADFGATWTNITYNTDLTNVGSPSSFSSVGDGRWMMAVQDLGGATVWYSDDDGLTWTRRTLPFSRQAGRKAMVGYYSYYEGA